MVFKCLDVVSHQAWNANPEGPAAQLAIELDRVLGRLLEAAGPDVDVFLVSDHGFRRYPRALDLEAFLLEGEWTVRGEEAPPEAALWAAAVPLRPAMDAPAARADRIARRLSSGPGSEPRWAPAEVSGCMDLLADRSWGLVTTMP